MEVVFDEYVFIFYEGRVEIGGLFMVIYFVIVCGIFLFYLILMY